MASVVDIGMTSGNALQEPRTVHRLRLEDGRGTSLDLIDLGAGIDVLRLPDRRGRVEDVTLTLASIEDREDPERNPYIGATVGRWANRLAGGRIEIDGVTHQLDTNEGPNLLHGGSVGFSHVVWDHVVIDGGIRFERVSPAGEMGFPGRVVAEVTYRLVPGVLTIDYEAGTDAPTVISLTNHAYWNLGGPAERHVFDHMIRIPASRVLPVDEHLLPAGPPTPVDDTPFDLRQPTRLGDRIPAELPEGYDHCFVPDGAGHRLHASLEHRRSGRWLEVWSDMPGTQLYTGWQLRGRATGGGRRHDRFSALCIEPQHLPDAPNRSWAPNAVLRPGDRYRHRIELRYRARG